MNTSLGSSWNLIKQAAKIFKKHPKFLAPLILVWLVYAPTILYLKYYFDWHVFDTFTQSVIFSFGIILFLSLLLALSCSVLLELIQQLETGRPVSLWNAFENTVNRDALKILPIVFAWAVLWLLLTLLQSLLPKKDRNRVSGEVSVESAAKILSGYGRIPLSRAFFDALKKNIRMIVFLILPAIAWEDLNPIDATKKGLGILKVHIHEFIAGYVLTEGVAFFVFAPFFVLVLITDKSKITLPNYVWDISIMYVAFAWSFSIYIEQMFTAQLYLWNMRWEKAVKDAADKGLTIPSIEEVAQPSLLDQTNDLDIS